MKRAATSASSLWRRALCPGSHHAEAGAPEDQTEWSREGTLMHYRDAVGADGDNPGQDYVLLRNAQLRDGKLAEIRHANGIPLEAQPFVLNEAQSQPEFWLYDEEGNKLFPGHPDWVHWYCDYAVLSVSDSKFGRKKVTAAEDNIQLKAYIVMLCDPEHGDFKEAEKIYGTITQPWAYPPVHSVLYLRQQIPDAKKELLEIWYNCQSPDAPRHPGLEQCWQCKARSTCRECIEMREDLIALKISEIPISALEAMAPRVQLLEQHAKSFWMRLEYIATEFPHLLNQFEMVPGSKRANIPNPIAAWERLNAAGLMTSQQFCECTKVNIGKLVEKVALNMKWSEKEARMVVEQTLAGVLEYKESKPQLGEKKIIQLNP